MALKITIIPVLLFWLCCSSAAASDGEMKAENITGFSQITTSGFYTPPLLTDGDDRTYTEAVSEGTITIVCDAYIGSLYLIFDRIPTVWQVTDMETGETIDCGQNSFLHEYIDIAEVFGRAPKKVRMDFSTGISIDEIYVFSEGETPEWVQKWRPPCEHADLLLLSSHSDDEQLFFAGVLPYYAGERGYKVQVVYLNSHFYNTHDRPHELLDGLWTVGVCHYPVIPDFPDLYSESLEEALELYGGYGYTYTDFVEYITENLRRFQPLVVVSHDINGEYGHGTHILCTSALRDALLVCKDSNIYPESAQLYGVWEPLKTYLHLYSKNTIVMDWDVPLEKFGGKTAFQMTQEGFSHHKSQHWTWFNKWLNGTQSSPVLTAAQINVYSPCLYGLYQTSVGYDQGGSDFFENIETYTQKESEALTESVTQIPANEKMETEKRTVTELHSESAQTFLVQGQKDTMKIVLVAAVSGAVLLILFSALLAAKRKQIRKFHQLDESRKRK